MPFLDHLNDANHNDAVIIPGYELHVPCFQGDFNTAGDVGLELEVEGRNLPPGPVLADIRVSNNAVWLAINDGSLRGGIEYVTSTPIKTSDIRKMIGGLFRHFETYPRCTVQNSNRCSTHVHVNAGDLKVNQVTSAIVLWCTFQTAFIKWHGITRQQNHFCLSSRDEDSMVEAWLDYLRNGRAPTRGNRPNIKYTALNVLPLFTQGSLEFRAGGPPDNEDKLVWWAKICNAIVRYAAENFSNPLSLGYALSEVGPEALLRDVLEFAKLGPTSTDRVFQELTADGQLAIDAMRDFRDVQVLIYSFPWDLLIEKINATPVPNPFEGKKPRKTIRLNDFVMPRFEEQPDNGW